jgi:hypothetical protein
MALQLFHAGKYGHSQRPGAVGALPVFGYPGDLAAAAPDWTNFSLAAHLSKQRAQPSVQPGVGLSVLNAVHFPRDTILESQAKTISDFIFGPLDDAATIPLTSANRFKGMSSSPVEALLMCGKFAVAISEDGDVIYGDPVLFVLDAPMVPHRGNLAMASQMWPGSSAFAPRIHVSSADFFVEVEVYIFPCQILLTRWNVICSSFGINEFFESPPFACIRGIWLDMCLYGLHVCRVRVIDALGDAAGLLHLTSSRGISTSTHFNSELVSCQCCALWSRRPPPIRARRGSTRAASMTVIAVFSLRNLALSRMTGILAIYGWFHNDRKTSRIRRICTIESISIENVIENPHSGTTSNSRNSLHRNTSSRKNDDNDGAIDASF